MCAYLPPQMGLPVPLSRSVKLCTGPVWHGCGYSPTVQLYPRFAVFEANSATKKYVLNFFIECHALTMTAAMTTTTITIMITTTPTSTTDSEKAE